VAAVQSYPFDIYSDSHLTIYMTLTPLSTDDQNFNSDPSMNTKGPNSIKSSRDINRVSIVDAK
jgi:hypothetical protein